MDESFLPKVSETDLGHVVYDDIVDPTHRERWRHHSRLNPVLAREVLNRAYTVNSEDLQNPIEVTKRIIDCVTFALSAVEAAAKRNRSEDDTTRPTSAY